mgnify:FL=1
MRDPASYQALDPEDFGRKREIVLGKHSGRAAVKHALARLGTFADDAQVARLVRLIRVHVTQTKRSLQDEELLALHAQAGGCP